MTKNTTSNLIGWGLTGAVVIAIIIGLYQLSSSINENEQRKTQCVEDLNLAVGDTVKIQGLNSKFVILFVNFEACENGRTQINVLGETGITVWISSDILIKQ